MYGVRQALDMLSLAVMERGEDYTYEGREDSVPKCLYFHEGRPDCIVGLVCSYVGILPDDLYEGEGRATEQLAIRERFTEEAAEVLEVAQIHQDQGYNWGYAVTKAKEWAHGRNLQNAR